MSEYIAKCNEVVGISGKALIVPDYIDTSKEIVRCRDCVNCYFDISSWMCGEFGFDVGNEDDGEPDGYCAWGERKEDGDGLDAS